MSQPVITVEGRRVYVQVRYGDPCVAALKELGAHWDAISKRWWASSAKREQVEAAVKASAGQPSTATNREVTVIGKARYKGRNYYVRWVGQCKSGDHKARLCSLDGKIDFWANCARPDDFHVTGDGDMARVTKTYQEARSLESIRQYVERLRNDKTGVVRGDKPDEDCYWGGEDWLVKGCGQCKLLGRMCKSCACDIYDN